MESPSKSHETHIGDGRSLEGVSPTPSPDRPRATSLTSEKVTVCKVDLRALSPNSQSSNLASGSATGNPRNKCALQPGHSLMDWIRLGNSGKDLTGVGGRMRGVTLKEVSIHSKRGDAWIALKGKVYNISNYLDYHPGGIEELMKGAGKDATKLFDQVHPWVNYESLLSKCLIGPLKQEQISAEEFSKLMFGNQLKSRDKLQEPPRVQDLVRKSMENLAYCITPVRKKVSNVAKSSSNNDFNSNKSTSDTTLNISVGNKKDQKINTPSKIIQTLVNSSDLSMSIMQQSSSSSTKTLSLNRSPERNNVNSKIPKVVITESNSLNSTDSISTITVQTDIPDRPKSPAHQLPNLPKFDWIQKSGSVTLIFYTKQLCNPETYVRNQSIDKPCIVVYFIYEGYKYSFMLNLESDIEWPCDMVVSHENGKIEIILRKCVPKIWQSFGLIEKTSIERAQMYSEDNLIKCQIVGTSKVTHNTSIIILKSVNSEYLTFPIGYHLRVFCDKPGNYVRSYTPVLPFLRIEDKPKEFTSECICLMVKRYEDGIVSSWLTDLRVGDLLTISKPLGSFQLRKLQNTMRLYLIAAGTGLTPMLSLIQFSLSRRNPKCYLVSLLFFNRTQDDILWNSQLDQLTCQDKRFKVTNVLSEPGPTWDRDKGHISKDFLMRHLTDSMDNSLDRNEECVDSFTTLSDYFVCVCGPSNFVHLTENLLLELECSSELIHLFMG